jgi:hypothetical protein
MFRRNAATPRRADGVTAPKATDPLLFVAGINRRKNVSNWRPKATAMQQHVLGRTTGRG